MHKQLKRIEDYQKTLGILEVYTAVQSEGSRQGYPTIVVRTSGCTHRCYFGEGGWCDSWYTSIHPEKGTFCFQDIIDMYDENPHIKEMMLTGGSPTMHAAIVNELTHFAQHNKLRLNYEAIKQSIEYHDDYHIKPVLDNKLSMIEEVEEFLKECKIPDDKVWAMPAGDDRESLMVSYGPVMNFVRDKGWRFTGRSHIMAFNTERCV